MGREFKCEKCGSKSYDKTELRTTGGKLSKLFDVQNKKFIAVSCSNCGYTELYRINDSGVLSNIFDFLTN
ncbi:MAG TPA: zinc ribbon domain-containing protein [Halanaerobiales bacterium]|nr:zinc ribbon domain-containing protein [Halanaerobiales bacterium]